MLIQSREQFQAALTVLAESELISIDTETTFTNVWDVRRIIGLSSYCEIPSKLGMFANFYFPFRHEVSSMLDMGGRNLPMEWLRELGSILEQKNRTYIFHNAKFDITVLRKEQIDIQAPFWDTMIMSWMINENGTHALKSLCKQVLDVDSDREQQILKKMHSDLGSWEALPPEVMDKYASKDAELTYRLFLYLKPLLDEQELTPLWKDEMDFCRVLLDMEWEGIGLNKLRAASLSERTAKRLTEIQDQLQYDPMKKSQLAKRLFGTPPEGLGLTPGPLSGSRSKDLPGGYIPIMDRATLSRYTHPEIALIMEYRGLAKAYSTWYEGFLSKCCQDGRLRPDFMRHGTKTSRLSCRQPNLQQIPRRKEEEDEEGITKEQVKTLFQPKFGFKLIEADYSQVEFRLAAVYAKEEAVLNGYRAGKDFHRLTAELLGIERQHAKTINFAILYGAGSSKLAEQLGCTVGEAKSVLDDYHSAYPNFRKVADQAQAAAAARKYVRYWSGRRRHFQWPSEFHKAWNSVIQGGAADILMQTMLKFYREKPVKSKMLCAVHDSLWFEVPEEEMETEVKIIKEVMEWPGEVFGLEFPVEIHPLYETNSN